MTHEDFNYKLPSLLSLTHTQCKFNFSIPNESRAQIAVTLQNKFFYPNGHSQPFEKINGRTTAAKPLAFFYLNFLPIYWPY